MASNGVNTGSAGRLVVSAVEVGYDVDGNWSDVSWAASLDERVESNSTWTSSAITAAVDVGLDGNDWSGTFSLDWRGGGLQSSPIASGVTRVFHEANGSSFCSVAVAIGSTGTTGGGGPASVTVGFWLTQLTRVPNTPTSVVASRVSDTKLNLSWNQSNPSNGQPESNQVYRSLNDGPYTKILDISATTSASVSASANQKARFKVSAWNGSGFSPQSSASPPVYTTPGAPTGTSASKNVSLNIDISFTPHVNYSEHEHTVEHGVVSGGVTTWDGSVLATLASGTSSYTHVAPNASQVHVYRVRAKAGSLASAYDVSNSVQLLVAPNKPTIPAMPQFFDKTLALPFYWVHNSVDTTPQKYYGFSYSTDGGATWTDFSKITSSESVRIIPANTYAAGTTLTMRVRTWGSATTGGSDGTGASPWSDLASVTFKTAPTASIVAPANGSDLHDATLRVTLGFSQPEAASFVMGTIRLLQGATLIEELDTSTLVGTQMAMQVANGVSYTVQARVRDSNGLWSQWVSSSFTVTYLAPVPAVVTLAFLPDSGFGQIDLTIAAPGSGQSAADKVTITRRIGTGIEEIIVQDYPASGSMTFLDTTPVINGDNTYSVTTTSAMGAQKTVVNTLSVSECRRAYLSKGVGFSIVVVFGANLSVKESLSVASDTVEAEGRIKPIGLYGIETSVQLKVDSFVFSPFGSTMDDLRSMLLMPGVACYRDASGRRVFGSVRGGVSYKKADQGSLSFTLTETS